LQNWILTEQARRLQIGKWEKALGLMPERLARPTATIPDPPYIERLREALPGVQVFPERRGPITRLTPSAKHPRIYQVQIRVYVTPDFGATPEQVDEILLNVAKFYAQYAVEINWTVIEMRGPRARFSPYLDELDLKLEEDELTAANLCREEEIQWYTETCEDVPSVFLIRTIDIRGWWRLYQWFRRDIEGLNQDNFSWVPGWLFPALVSRDAAIAHELGHMFGLHHPRATFSLMQPSPITKLETAFLTEAEVAEMQQWPGFTVKQ
jgi:hypothetical protein